MVIVELHWDKELTMAFSVNKFSSRILPSKNHTPLEALAVMVFFLIILTGLLIAGYKARMGALVYLYSLAILLTCLAIFTELYFIVQKWLQKPLPVEDQIDQE
jgi:hypothetical protein